MAPAFMVQEVRSLRAQGCCCVGVESCKLVLLGAPAIHLFRHFRCRM